MDEKSKIEQLEKTIEAMSERLEKIGENIADRVEDFEENLNENINKSSESDESKSGIEKKLRRSRRNRGDTFFWGVILIAIGTFWIARNLGWFVWRIEFWPSALIILGLYILIRNPRL